MGKKIVNKRLAETKAPLKKKKAQSFKKSVQTARDIHYYGEGEGSKGVCIRKSRLIKRTRRLNKELSANEDDKKRNGVIFKGYAELMTNALDGYTKRLIECAAEIAQEGMAKDAKGVKLKKKHLELAKRWIFKISNQ